MKLIAISTLLVLAGVSAGLAALGKIRRNRQKKTISGRVKLALGKLTA